MSICNMTKEEYRNAWFDVQEKCDILIMKTCEFYNIIKAIEWIDLPDGTFCPNCGQRKEEGHSKDCELGKAIRIEEHE